MSTKKVLLLLSGLLFVTLFSVLAMTAEVKQSATMVAIENQQVVQGPVSRAACTMAKHNDVAAYYYEHYQTGVGTYTYFNPALMCPTPTYPFEISSFSFTLYAPTGYVWPAMVDVVVYALAQPPDSCRGPGSELCRYSLTANQATYGFPTVGSYAFPTPCYVNGPFYIGLEYTAGVEGSTPSVLVDNNVPPVVYCDNWMRWTDGLYYEWSNFWTSGSVGYPLFWVGGETVSLAQTGDVTVQFNGGGANNKVFIGEENTLQIFIKNPGGAIYGMSLGFGFTSAVPGFSWKTPYGNKPLPPKPKYVQEYGDAVDKFDVGGFHCDMPSPPTPFLMGGAADVAPLPVHATSTMLYDLKLIMPAAPGEYPGGFSIDNVFVPPAGSWKFDQLGGIDYPPTFQGNGNTSPEIPDAPPVYFDIVHRSDWDPGDPYKMHFPQLPNESGWDVNATDPVVLAEDWQCSETGWVKDIHFWGSWKNGIVGQIQYFNLMICSDIPANPPQIPYSRPGPSLWHRQIPNMGLPRDPHTMEGWYDPSTGEIIPNDHQSYFQYNIGLDSLDWFRQVEGTIYWLTISAVLEDPQNTKWGWKTTLNHWNDDAVWASWDHPDWVDLWEPSQPIQNQFYVGVDPQGVLMGGGTGYFGQGWYLYPTGWWNIWFYDNPFTYDRGNNIRIEFDLGPMFMSIPSFVVLAVNWSTDRWSLVPQQDSMPPHPGVPEELYIGRDTLLVGPDLTGHYAFDYVIRDYNPEWVSVDVMGSNFVVRNGFITHDCRQSLDLSFVITNGDTLIYNYKPGDANGDVTIDISDAVYLISYIFSGGLAPIPYAICSGDANCDCAVDISDAVYLISYIFSGGSAPCNGQQWLTQCGPPLRK